MPASVSSRTIALPAAVAFRRLTALANHERLIPFTTVEVPDRPPRVGDVAVATTLGLLRDTMELVTFEPPARDAVGRAVWVKRGPILFGGAEIHVTPLSPTSCRVDWIERDITWRNLSASTAPLTAMLGLMTHLALARFGRLTSAPARRGRP